MPIFFDIPRDALALKKVHLSLNAFEEHLKRGKTKFAAANHLTLADLGLIAGTLSLECIEFSLKDYPLVENWYATFKKEYPELWAVAYTGARVIAEYEKVPPNLDKLDHPLYPRRKF